MHEVRWRVGVLRNGEENVVWVYGSSAPDWGHARSATIAAVHELIAAEGVHEYRFRVDDAEGIVNPRRSASGTVEVGDLGRLIPADRDAH